MENLTGQCRTRWPQAAARPHLAWLALLALALTAPAAAAPVLAAGQSADTESAAPAPAPTPTAPGVLGQSPQTGGTGGLSASAVSEHTGGQAASATPMPGPATPVAKSPAGTLGVADKPARLPPTLGTKEQDFSRLLWESLAAVLVILAIGGVGIVLVRRLMPRISVARGKRIVLRESLHLGPQRMVHLVRVGSRQLLVGTSRDAVSMLADGTAALPPPAEAEEAAKPRCVGRVNRPAADDVGSVDPTYASDEAEEAAKPRKKFVIPPLDDPGDAGKKP